MEPEQQFKPVQGQPSSHGDFQRNWGELRSKVHARWPQLTDEDIQLIDGDARKLTALVHQKTGAETSDIEQELAKMTRTNNGPTAGAEKVPAEKPEKPEKAQAGNERTMESMATSVQETATAAAKQVQSAAVSGYRQMERGVSAAPLTSTGVAFATGAVIGLCLAMVCNDYDTRRSSRWYGYW